MSKNRTRDPEAIAVAIVDWSSITRYLHTRNKYTTNNMQTQQKQIDVTSCIVAEPLPLFVTRIGGTYMRVNKWLQCPRNNSICKTTQPFFHSVYDATLPSWSSGVDAFCIIITWGSHNDIVPLPSATFFNINLLCFEGLSHRHWSLSSSSASELVP